MILGLDDLPSGGQWEKEVAVPNRLCDDECHIQGQGRDRSEGQLGRVNSGPGRPVVNVGSTRLKVARVVTVASAAPVPAALNS